MKVSFDWDDTLSTDKGKLKLAYHRAKGDELYVISARNSFPNYVLDEIAALGISKRNAYATSSNKKKIEKVKELNIDIHYDNNVDVVNALGKVGKKI